MTSFADSAPKTHGQTGFSVLIKGAAHLVRLPRQWATRRQSRMALARLDPRLTRDIGLDQVTRDAEARRPFWR